MHQGYLVGHQRLVSVAMLTLPFTQTPSEQFASRAILLMHGVLLNSTSRTLSRALMKRAAVFTMAAHPAVIVIPPLYSSRVVFPAMKAITLMMAKAAGTMMIS